MGTIDIDVKDMKDFFSYFDDGEGVIVIEDFTRGMLRMRGAATGIDVVTVLKAIDKLNGRMEALIKNTSGLQELNSLEAFTLDLSEPDKESLAPAGKEGCGGHPRPRLAPC